MSMTALSMTIDATIDTTVDVIALVMWVAGGVVAGLLVSYVVTGVTRVLARRHPVAGIITRRGRRPFQAMLVVVGAWVGLVLGAPLAAGIREPGWRAVAQHVLLILLIIAGTWFVAQMVRVVEDAALEHIRARGGAASGRDRRVQTQAQVLRRVAFAVVVILGIAAAMLTFPGARAAGASLLASAGIVSVVAGLAAQTTLGNLIAGLQLAFTDAIRVDDIVIVEGEFGYIEEITLTYVVVRLWDDRRMIMPSTYFTTTPFENWTRQAPALLGTVELDVDWRVPVPAMRAELERLLEGTDMWDRRVGIFQVYDATGGFIRVRALVSGKDAPTLTDLKYYVREHLVDWLQTHAPYALPRQRTMEEWVETTDDRAAELYGELAEELTELADLDGAETPEPDTLALAQTRQEDPEERRRRESEARRARRRAAREDRRRAREHGGLPGRAAEERARPSSDATRVLDLAEVEAAADEESGARAVDGAAAVDRTDPSAPRRTSIIDRVDPPVVVGRVARTGHEASVFTGSKEAEERAKAFTGPSAEVLQEREITAERKRAEESPRTPTEGRAGELYGKDAAPDGDTN
jgi:small-conductance mechanosensitive channel